MDPKEAATPNATSDLPTTVLRSEMIEPGDVLLTHGGGSGSEMIATMSVGEFSHAALVVNQAMLFESDGGVIGHKAIRWLGWGTIAGKPARLACLLTDPKRLALYRHPGLRNLPAGTFEAALRAELEHSYGRDYSEMYRLVPLANLPDKLKPLVAAAFKLYERSTLTQQIPGPFCSELVSRVYERMGLALFEQGRPAEEISPNHLAKSNLVRVEEAVISSSSVVGYEAMEPSRNIAEKLYPAAGDRLAYYRRAQRSIERELDKLDEISRNMREQSRAQLADLRSVFEKQIESAFQLFTKEQKSGNEGLERWTLRICNNFIEFAPTLAALSEQPLDMESMKKVLLKVDELGTSLFRCSMISNSQLLRRAVAANNSPIKRFRLRRARGKILKEAREFLHSRSGFRTFIGEMLTSIPV
jgi:hypothetical protein